MFRSSRAPAWGAALHGDDASGRRPRCRPVARRDGAGV